MKLNSIYANRMQSGFEPALWPDETIKLCPSGAFAKGQVDGCDHIWATNYG